MEKISYGVYMWQSAKLFIEDIKGMGNEGEKIFPKPISKSGECCQLTH